MKQTKEDFKTPQPCSLKDKNENIKKNGNNKMSGWKGCKRGEI